MKRYLLLVLAALGLFAFVPSQAKSDVVVGFSSDEPVYYGPRTEEWRYERWRRHRWREHEWRRRQEWRERHWRHWHDEDE